MGILLLAAMLAGASASGILGPSPEQEAKLIPFDAPDFNDFGDSVALDGDTALVGDRKGGSSTDGVVYVFTRDASGTWSQQATLTPFDTTDPDDFGHSVALDGDTALVGDNSAGPDDDGAAYVFTRDGSGTWSAQAKLAPNDDTIGDLGFSVALDGDTALVGDDDAGASNEGAAYVFARDGSGAWSQQATLTSFGTTDPDDFGLSVALDGDTALVGDPHAWPSDIGAAYIFTRGDAGAWTQRTKLQPFASFDPGKFGWSVALDGDTALVSDPRAELLNDGVAYVFTRASPDVWIQQARITPLQISVNGFGDTVALAGDTALFGADENGPDRDGVAYVFMRASEGVWIQQAKLNPSDRHGHFGWSVALDAGSALEGGTALVGDPGAGSFTGGAAYVFDVVGLESWAR